LLIALVSAELSFAQHAYFGSRGKISFDRITYTRARMREMMSNMDNTNRGGRGMQMRIGGGDINNIPETQTQKMDLYFDENHTLMLHADPEAAANPQAMRVGRQGRGNMSGGRGQGSGRSAGASTPRPNMRNLNAQKAIYQDLKKSESQIQMTIDEKYILSDSLSPITWRFTDEYRNIAGFECR